MDADTILLYLNILLQQNVTQFSQNPPIHHKRRNDVLRDKMNMDVSCKSNNYTIGRTPNFSASISHICEKAIKQRKPLK